MTDPTSLRSFFQRKASEYGLTIPSKEWTCRKCWNYPKCFKVTFGTCPFFHPRTMCRYGAACRYGPFCHYKHEICVMDGRCEQELCPFEHKLDMATLWKLQNKYETENARTTVKRGQYKNKKDNANSYSIDKTTKNAIQAIGDSLASINVSPTPRDYFLRSKHFIRCDQYPNECVPKCEFAHPKIQCKLRRRGICKQGRLCGYLHEKCPSDGDCKDISCESEHYEQRHPAHMAKAEFFDGIKHKEMARHRLEELFGVKLSGRAMLPFGVDLTHECIA